MMKILHTSDWHLGHTLYEYDRSAEMASFADQLVAIAHDEQPDALLVCGDVYDRAQPSNTAHELYINTLLRLRRECPEMQIVVAAGNHDSKAALQLEGRIWEKLAVRVVGQPERREDGKVNWEQMIVPVERHGTRLGYVIAVPHIYDLNYPSDDPALPREERKRVFFGRLTQMVAERNSEALPVAMMAHLWVEGSDATGHSFSNRIGGIDVTPISELGSPVDYIALGHIHGGQEVSRHPAARYCGSPLPMSFDERGPHEVLAVQLEAGQPPAVKHWPIFNPAPLLTIPAQPASFEKALAELQQVGNSQAGYLRLNLLRDGSRPPDFVERIAHVLQGKLLKYCTLQLHDLEELPAVSTEAITFDEIRAKNPLEVASLHYARVTGQEEMPAEWKAMFASIVNTEEA